MKVRFWIACVALFSLAACATSAGGGLRATPAGLGPVSWSTTAADVIEHPKRDQAVIWIGRVIDVSYWKRDDKLVMEWTCENLPMVHPGEAALEKRPIAVQHAPAGTFVINLEQIGMSENEASRLARAHEASLHYVVVAGSVDAVVSRLGVPTVFLHTRQFELSRELATEVD